ncbi:hypothetical protein PC116_g24954 [Phytophthora cactorum]|uniref:Uncharacterized protein n=1 Tax=Phytophthora cactorum TaxID=29920 RepID=A0A8T1B1G1_9STRA|nr:hypothetical protein Pcac1_g28311 [Phytophthora cactorum]KAG2759688.1 hypothetical protein Pcac1_g28308 [Phytophthora cactorum]KAG2876772.1 hypothetical protein PC114_g24019 [Phytophthora cactorum]KAG2892707.1 hypothetical protein PC117_g23955 [Phytophthora cactorum]KAG2976180.1 hypothetical protein PC120_g25733 [Phytophthora cactorum]
MSTWSAFERAPQQRYPQRLASLVWKEGPSRRCLTACHLSEGEARTEHLEEPVHFGR